MTPASPDRIRRGVAIVATALGTLRHDPAELRSRAGELLSRPPYSPDAQGPLEQVLRWLRDRVAAALDALLSTLGQGTAVAWGVVVLGLLLLLVAGWYATRGLVLDRRAPVGEVAVPGRSSADWLAEAARHEAAGRWRSAVRCRYGALVTRLVETGTLDDAPGRTVGELTAAVAAAAPHLHGHVDRASARFEAVWYGNEPATEADVAVVAEALAAVAEAGTSTAVPA